MIEYHNTLNPLLWNNNELKIEIRDKLIEIYQTFVNQLKENEIPIDVVDVLLLGSNASYNYTDKSDIDLHIVVDFSDLPLNDTLTQLFYNNEKSKFNDEYDISIKKLPVEVYIEDVNAGTMSNGIYSLIRNKWIKFPEYNPPKDINYDLLLDKYKNDINNVLSTNSIEAIKEMINEIKMLRKISLMNNGEYSKGNLVFKALRNDGSIDSLYDKMKELISQELSLESLKEANTLLGRIHSTRLSAENVYIMRSILYTHFFKNAENIFPLSKFNEFLKTNNLSICHIDGDTKNNKLDNLMLLSNSMHENFDYACERYSYKIYPELKNIDENNFLDKKFTNKNDPEIWEIINKIKKSYKEFANKYYSNYTMSHCKNEIINKIHDNKNKGKNTKISEILNIILDHTNISDPKSII